MVKKGKKNKSALAWDSSLIRQGSSADALAFGFLSNLSCRFSWQGKAKFGYIPEVLP
jgi:hypothetical protein